MRIPKDVEPDAYLQAKHFCWQYSRYKREYAELANTYNGISTDGMPRGNNISNPVANATERREKLANKIQLIESVAHHVGDDLYPYVLAGMTRKDTGGKNCEISYDDLNREARIPCSRTSFHILRQQAWKEIMWQL